MFADPGKSIDPAGAQMVQKFYVDDGIGGGSNKDVDNLIEKETWKVGRPEYIWTIPKILAIGGFKVKVMVCDGEDREEVMSFLGSGVLRVIWDSG